MTDVIKTYIQWNLEKFTIPKLYILRPLQTILEQKQCYIKQMETLINSLIQLYERLRLALWHASIRFQ